jgi:DNA-binding SARP family transcriptional activator
MRISILGPLEVVGPQGPVTFTARRQQIVLAVMLWNANRVVPMEVLIDALWGQEPPATARSQVHISVSGIRKRLARGGLHELLSTCPPGYRTRVRDGELDLHEFDQHVTTARAQMLAGRAEEAAESFTLALRLWRGEPFAGVRGERVSAIAAQLADKRVSVFEELTEVRLRLGRGVPMIGDLTTLVAEHPYRELLRAQLMTALCQAGRQVEALREYRHMRALFDRELGLEPSPRLRLLEQEILTGAQPVLSSHATVPDRSRAVARI